MENSGKVIYYSEYECEHKTPNMVIPSVLMIGGMPKHDTYGGNQ